MAGITRDTSLLCRAQYRRSSGRHKQAIQGPVTRLPGPYDDLGRAKLGAELYGRFYEPLTPVYTEIDPTPEVRVAEVLHEALAASKGFAELVEYTRADAYAAAAALAAVLPALADVQIPPLPDPPEDAQPGDADYEHWLDALDAWDLPHSEKARLGAAVSRQVAEAIEDEKVVREAAHAIGQGAGREPGTDPAELRDRVRQAFRAHPQRWERFFALLGQVQRQFAEARSRSRNPVEHGGSPSSVRPGDQIRKMIPSELALHAIPQTRTLAAHRLLTRQALTYEHTRRAKEPGGPLVIALDRSGSMQGEPYEQAIALAVATLVRAAERNRQVRVVLFDCSTWLSPSDLDVTREAGRLALVEWLMGTSTDGGTDIDGALEAAGTAAAQLATKGKRADILLMTDGEDNVHRDRVARALEHARADLSYVMIGRQPNRVLASLATRVVVADHVLDPAVVQGAFDASADRSAPHDNGA